jgi:Lrp/AsnC family transcriptional regulator, leucine-responsive regulatory protein
VSPRAALALDALDHKLLACLQEDAGRTLAALGEAVGLSPSAVQRRINRYRGAGLITRQVALLDPEAVRGAVLAAVLVTLRNESSQQHKAFRKRMREAPEVQQCYALAGERDYFIIVAARGLREVREAVDRLFMDGANVKRYSTHIVFDVVKAGLRIPTGPAAAGSGRP